MMPAFSPLQTLRQEGIKELAAREAEKARVAAEKASCAALAQPLIHAWDEIFKTVELFAPDWGARPENHRVCWGDFYGRPSTDPVERYCCFKWEAAHESHVRLFKIQVLIPSRDAQPVIRINARGASYRDFDNWYAAFQFCVESLMPLLDESSLAALKAL